MTRTGRRQGTKNAMHKAAQGATKHAKRKAVRQITARRHKNKVPIDYCQGGHEIPNDAESELSPEEIKAENIIDLSPSSYTPAPPCPTCGVGGTHSCVTKSNKACKDHAGRVREDADNA